MLPPNEHLCMHSEITIMPVKLLHLGTGAAERIPAIFCRCRVCENAKRTGGKEIRTQAQALVNNDVLIDFGGDSYLHYLQRDLPFAELSALLITQWHSDHFYGEDLAYCMHAYGNSFEGLMTVYGTEAVRKFYQRAFDLEEQSDPSRLRFQVVRSGERFDVLDGKYCVYVFAAKHGHASGDCVFYGVSDGAKALLYAHDTAYFSEAAWRQLADSGLVFDYVSLDCTSGFSGVYSDVHMRLEENVRVRDRLMAVGLAREDTLFVANHFSHNAHATHAELAAEASRFGFRVAYDGMLTEF